MKGPDRSRSRMRLERTRRCLQLVLVLSKGSRLRLEPLAFSDVQHNDICLGAILEGVLGHGLPVVEHALWEGLA